MIKKLYSTLGILILQSTVAVSGNIYVGIDSGSLRSQTNLTATKSFVVARQTEGQDTRTLAMNDTAYSLGLLLGVRHESDNYFVAANIYGAKDNLGSSRHAESSFADALLPIVPLFPAQRFRISMINTFGIGVMTGLKIQENFKPFISFDVLTTQMQLESNSMQYEGSPFTSASQKKYLWGIAPGLGLEYAFDKNISARLSYQVRIYKKFDAKDTQSMFDPALPSDTDYYNVKSSFRPIVHALKIGLIYNF